MTRHIRVPVAPSATAVGAGAAPAPAATGGDLPTIYLNMTTSSVPIGGRNLAWVAPDGDITHNVGGAFTFDVGTPTVITVVDRCLVDVLVHVNFIGEDGDQRFLTLGAPEWAPNYFYAPSLVAAGDNTTTLIATGAYCLAGGIITIGAGHDASGTVPVNDGFIMMSRRVLL